MKMRFIGAAFAVAIQYGGSADAAPAQARAETAAWAVANEICDAATMVAKMLRGGVEFNWLFEPVIMRRVEPLPEQRAEADTMIKLERAARSRDLAARPDVAAAMRGAETLILANAMRRSLIDSVNPSDKEVATRIREHPGRFDEYRVSHIFVRVGALPDGKVRTDEEALAIARRLRARVAAGEAFANVAREASEDRTTATEGGGLPVMRGTSMKDLFLPHIQRLARDETSEAIRSPDGYHLVHLDQRTSATSHDARYWVVEDIIRERLPRMIEDAITQANSAAGKRGE